MPTVERSEYESQDMNEPIPQTEITGSYASASLGPLHVPVSVMAEVDGRNCRFDFSYVNSEAPEATFRTLSLGQTQVLLGRHTKKILSLVFEDAAEVLRRGDRLFDPLECGAWCGSLGRDRQFTCRRNAEIVGATLAALPEDIRHSLIERLTRQRNA